jgi:hypothetical protein
MYKDDPGVFLDVKGVEVGAEEAAAAGYDVETLLFQRRRKELARKALESVDAQMEEQRLAALAAADEKAADEVAEQRAKTPKPSAVKERIGETLESGEPYKLKHISFGRFQVVGPDGQSLLKKPVQKAEAQALADDMNEKARAA